MDQRKGFSEKRKNPQIEVNFKRMEGFFADEA